MASAAISVETVTITISGTSTNNTGSITLGQDADYCTLRVTQCTPATSNLNFNCRTVRVELTGTTITATRNTGTDIGTITVKVTVIEWDPAEFSIERGTATNTNAEDTVTLGTTVDQNAAFLDFTHSTPATNEARYSLSRGTIETDGTGLIFTRVSSTSQTDIEWCVTWAHNSGMLIEHISGTLAASAETFNVNISDVDAEDKTFVIASMSDQGSGITWRTSACVAYLSGTTEAILERSNGGSAQGTAIICWLQVCQFTSFDETVQRGSISISGTSNTATLADAVDLDAATVHSPMFHGIGHANSSTDADLGDWFATLEVTDTTTVTAIRGTDITADSEYYFEVISWAISSEDQTMSPTLSGVGSLTAVFSVNVPLEQTLAGSGSLVIDSETNIPLTQTFVGVGTLVLDEDVDVTFSPDFDGIGELVLSASVSGETMEPTFAGAGELIVATAVNILSVQEFAGTGTLVVTAVVAEAVTEMQLFGRFVVVDSGQLSEVALRKIAYVRQRER